MMQKYAKFARAHTLMYVMLPKWISLKVKSIHTELKVINFFEAILG